MPVIEFTDSDQDHSTDPRCGKMPAAAAAF
jgi:hypothetical protein